eukprot:SAG22_NODE_541_length_9297_cov_9.387149_8_plen_156_part_00
MAPYASTRRPRAAGPGACCSFGTLGKDPRGKSFRPWADPMAARLTSVLAAATVALAAAAPHHPQHRQLTQLAAHHHKAKEAVACSAQQSQGLCIKAAPLFGSYNDTKATADDCCAQCKKYSFVTPQMATPCVNYTFNATDGKCSLYPLASRKLES